MIGMVIRFLLLYLCSGLIVTTMAWFVTGVPQFGVDVIGPSLEASPAAPSDFLTREAANLPLLALAFLLNRFAVAVLVATVLVLCLRIRCRRPSIYVLGVGLPVLCEVLLARPYAHSWVGMLIATSMRSAAAVVPPFAVVVRTSVAYVVPPLLAGLIVSSYCAYKVKSLLSSVEHK